MSCWSSSGKACRSRRRSPRTPDFFGGSRRAFPFPTLGNEAFPPTFPPCCAVQRPRGMRFFARWPALATLGRLPFSLVLDHLGGHFLCSLLLEPSSSPSPPALRRRPSKPCASMTAPTPRSNSSMKTARPPGTAARRSFMRTAAKRRRGATAKARRSGRGKAGIPPASALGTASSKPGCARGCGALRTPPANPSSA